MSQQPDERNKAELSYAEKLLANLNSSKPSLPGVVTAKKMNPLGVALKEIFETLYRKKPKGDRPAELDALNHLVALANKQFTDLEASDHLFFDPTVIEPYIDDLSALKLHIYLNIAICYANNVGTEPDNNVVLMYLAKMISEEEKVSDIAAPELLDLARLAREEILKNLSELKDPQISAQALILLSKHTINNTKGMDRDAILDVVAELMQAKAKLDLLPKQETVPSIYETFFDTLISLVPVDITSTVALSDLKKQITDQGLAEAVREADSFATLKIALLQEALKIALLQEALKINRKPGWQLELAQTYEWCGKRDATSLEKAIKTYEKILEESLEQPKPTVSSIQTAVVAYKRLSALKPGGAPVNRGAILKAIQQVRVGNNKEGAEFKKAIDELLFEVVRAFFVPQLDATSTSKEISIGNWRALNETLADIAGRINPENVNSEIPAINAPFDSSLVTLFEKISKLSVEKTKDLISNVVNLLIFILYPRYDESLSKELSRLKNNVVEQGMRYAQIYRGIYYRRSMDSVTKSMFWLLKAGESDTTPGRVYKRLAIASLEEPSSGLVAKETGNAKFFRLISIAALKLQDAPDRYPSSYSLDASSRDVDALSRDVDASSRDVDASSRDVDASPDDYLVGDLLFVKDCETCPNFDSVVKFLSHLPDDIKIAFWLMALQVVTIKITHGSKDLSATLLSQYGDFRDKAQAVVKELTGKNPALAEKYGRLLRLPSTNCATSRLWDGEESLQAARSSRVDSTVLSSLAEQALAQTLAKTRQEFSEQLAVLGGQLSLLREEFSALRKSVIHSQEGGSEQPLYSFAGTQGMWPLVPPSDGKLEEKQEEYGEEEEEKEGMENNSMGS